MAVATYAVVEPIVGHVIEPLVRWQSSDLSPLAIIVSAVFWTALWEPGRIAGGDAKHKVPRRDRPRQRARLTGCRVPRSTRADAAEVFYQRLLAGSAFEPVYDAEHALKEMPLIAHFDGIALPGLKLAPIDAKWACWMTTDDDTIRRTTETLTRSVNGDGR